MTIVSAINHFNQLQGKLANVAQNAVFNASPLAFKLYKILLKILGSQGFNLLGTYNLTYQGTGQVFSTTPAIAIENITSDDGFIRSIQPESGIECIIRQNVVPRMVSQFFGGHQIISEFEIVLDQHNPREDLSLAINAIYATPIIAPLQRNQPLVRQRMRSPDGVVQPARAELKISFSNHQPQLLIK